MSDASLPQIHLSPRKRLRLIVLTFAVFAAFAALLLTLRDPSWLTDLFPARRSYAFVPQPPAYRSFASLDLAIQTAKKENKPLFLDLYAVWCLPCKKLEEETFSHPSVASLLSRFLVVKFDVDTPQGKPILQRYGVSRFPTTLMLTPDGQEAERVIGFFPPRFFRPALEGVLSGEGRYSELSKRVRQTPGRLPLQLQLADRALLRRLFPEAERIYSALLRLDPTDRLGFGSAALLGIIRLRHRDSRYKDALQEIQSFHKRFPQSPLRIDVSRFEISCLEKLADRKRHQEVLSTFQKLYPSQPLDFF